MKKLVVFTLLTLTMHQLYADETNTICVQNYTDLTFDITLRLEDSSVIQRILSGKHSPTSEEYTCIELTTLRNGICNIDLKRGRPGWLAILTWFRHNKGPSHTKKSFT